MKVPDTRSGDSYPKERTQQGSAAFRSAAGHVGMADGVAEQTPLYRELLARQVELEMQNKDLLETVADLESRIAQAAGAVSSDPLELEECGDMDLVFNLSPDLIGIVTREGNFVRLNPAFIRLLGRNRGNAEQGNLFDTVHPDDLEPTRRALAWLQDGRDLLNFVNRHRGRDGSYRWLEWRATSFRGDLVCVLARDITERRRADEALRLSEEKFRNIFESSPMAMYLYHLTEDDRLLMVGANPAADRETGIRHGVLYGKTAEEAFPALVGTGVQELFKDVAKGRMEAQSFVIRYDDERIAGHFDVRVFRTGPGAVVVAFMDISERMKVEQELAKARDELEQRVRHRTAQLEDRTRQLRALANELIRAEELERRRIAGLIHDDLQQALVAASLNLRMLRKSVAAPAAARDIDRVTEIIRDAVAISRSLTSELSPPVLQQGGLAAALAWLRAWCKDKYGLEVRLDVCDDADTSQETAVMLSRVVRELLFNIVKHAGVKEADLRMERGDDGCVAIAVSDKGAGFDPDRVRAHEGVKGGFGLFNIRERLEMFGGSLVIDSAPGRGSTVTVRVPAKVDMETLPPAVPTPEKTRAPGRSLDDAASSNQAGGRGDVPTAIRVIVADDHPEVRDGLVRMLESTRNFEVVAQAEDGVRALELARHHRPHFVLMDLNMPRMDGIQATRAIRAELPCIKVLGLSTHADETHRAAMIRAGAVDLLHKNVPEKSILDLLEKHASCQCAASGVAG